MDTDSADSFYKGRDAANPLQCLPSTIKQSLIQDYYEIVTDLAAELSSAAAYRFSSFQFDGSTPLVSENIHVDYVSEQILWVKSGLDECLSRLDSLFALYQQDFWQVKAVDLGSYLEQLVHYKWQGEEVLILHRIEVGYETLTNTIPPIKLQ